MLTTTIWKMIFSLSLTLEWENVDGLMDEFLDSSILWLKLQEPGKGMETKRKLLY